MSQQILLADNNVQIVETIGDYLGELGFSVFRAATGTAAKEIIVNENLNILILSLGLKNPSSKELFTMAKESSSSPLIILLAEEFEYSDVQKLATEGVFDYLIKPFDEKQLQKTVERAIKAHQAIMSKSILVRQLLSRTKKLESLTVEQAKKLAELHSLKENTTSALGEHDALTRQVNKLTLALKEKDQTILDCQAKIREVDYLPPLNKSPLHRKVIVILTTVIAFLLLYPALLPDNILIQFPEVSVSGVTLSNFTFLLSATFLCISIFASLYTIRRTIYSSIKGKKNQPFMIRLINSSNFIAPALILLLQGYTLHFLYSGFHGARNYHLQPGSAVILGSHILSEITLSKGITLLMLALILMFIIILQEIILLKYTITLLYANYAEKSSTRTRIKSL